MLLSHEDALKQVSEMALANRERLMTLTEAIDIVSGDSSACSKALGRKLARDVLSPLVSPPFANSAMDGFALRSNETLKTRDFKICGALFPGTVPQTQTPTGCAWEITTGAPMPLDCDAVVKIEDIASMNADRSALALRGPVSKSSFVREAGQDFEKGSVVLRKGTSLQALHLMALASVNIARVEVYKKPRVILLPTGRELYNVGSRGEPGQIVNSSAIYLSTVWRELGCEVEVLPPIRDDLAAFDGAIQSILNRPSATRADLLVTTGAVSMGSADFVSEGLKKNGFETHFHKLAIRPGKPILFASKKTEAGSLVVFGLPGNPISSVVGSRFLVEEYLETLLDTPKRLVSDMILKEAVSKPEGLKCFFRGSVVLGGTSSQVAIHPEQGSSLIRPFVESDVWVVLPASGSDVPAGARVEVHEF